MLTARDFLKADRNNLPVWTKVVGKKLGNLTTNRSLSEGDTIIVGSFSNWCNFAIGDSVLILPTSIGDICLGKAIKENVTEGEIVIQNKAGAVIKLMSDGKVQINSKIFD